MLTAVENGGTNLILSQTDIVKSFGSQIKDYPEIIQRLVNLCRSFNVTIETLVNKWEALALSQAIPLDSIPNNSHINIIQNQIKLEADQNRSTIGPLISKPAFHEPFKDLDMDSIDSLLDGPVLVKKKVSLSGSKNNRKIITPSTPLQTTKINPSQNKSMNNLDKNSPYESKISQNLTSPLPKHSLSASLKSTFESRATKFNSIDSFNSRIPIEVSDKPCNISVSIAPNQLLTGYRYMYERLYDQGAALNDMLSYFEPIILELIQNRIDSSNTTSTLDQSETPEPITLSDPSCPHQEYFYTVGRICFDSLSENQQFNNNSIMLEVSRSLGIGSRVKLDVSQLVKDGIEFKLFPGQIIGLKGLNPSGKLIKALELYPPPDLPTMSTSLTRLIEFYPTPETTRPLEIITASGPFTFSDDLSFIPFQEFITHLSNTNIPDTLILLGPFIDLDHVMIKSGDTDMIPEQLFKEFISNPLCKLVAKKPSLNIILIPSTRDICSEWVYYPQPPLASAMTPQKHREQKETLGLDLPNIALLPNPCQFQINEILFAATSEDVLFDMNQYCSLKSASDQPDRLTQLTQLIIEQRNMYPLYPTEKLDIDFTRLSDTMLQATPDILILPSRLKSCVKSSGEYIWTNPGSIAKGNQGGTYVRMIVYPLDIESMKLVGGDGLFFPHLVSQRTRVELIKL